MNQESTKTIVVFAGSNSSRSINKKLVKYAISLLKEEFQINLLDLNDFEMPIYSIDREKNSGIPEAASQFRKHMEDADAIICSLAEHNRSYSVAFKNIFDWCSRIDLNIFRDKPMLLMTTSTGGYGGGNVMTAAKNFFPKCHADIIETFSLASFNQSFQDEKIVDEKADEELKEKLDRFIQHLNQ